MKYAVRINYRQGGSRYVKWCDNYWHETSNNPHTYYELEEARDVMYKLRDHYCYNLDLVDENGKLIENVNWVKKVTTTYDDTIAPNKYQPMKPKAEKKMFKLNSSILSKGLKKFGNKKW